MAGSAESTEKGGGALVGAALAACEFRLGRDELAAEGFGEDGLGELVGALGCGFDPLLERIGEFEEGFDPPDDFPFFVEGRNRNYNPVKICL